MARKYDLISAVYERTAKTVSDSPANWQSFLRSACRNFKLRFDEQLLVYAQRPDATAVLEIERWNGAFGRWVNRGARGIAVFDDADRSRQRLKHYFDISDTHESRYSRPVPIWRMKPEYEAEVIETLENTFGDLQYKGTLEEAIVCAAENAVEDNLYSYTEDLIAVRGGSFLEELDELSIHVRLRQLVTDSVAFMIMSRLDLEPMDYFDSEDFTELWEFNTPEVLNVVGFATSDISEMALTEISRTIHALDRQNRTIAEKAAQKYNEPETKTERSSEHERDQLHDAGRLSAAGSGTAGAAGGDSGQIRRDAEEVPEGASSGAVLQSSDELQADGTSGRGGTESGLNGGDAGSPDGGERGRDGESEIYGHDGLGSPDEQSEELGAGDRVDGSGLRLNWHERSGEDNRIPFLGANDVNAILLATPHLKKSKALICEFLESMPDEHTQTEFIKDCFNNDYTEVILDDGRRMGYKTYENVLHLWEGSYQSRTKQTYYNWSVVAARFEGLRLLGELQDKIKPLPSMEAQQSLIEETEEKSPVFSFSQEIIDAVLTRGSGVSEGKFRIYEQFQKSLSAKENVKFLKKEYGWGGSYPVLTGTGIDEQHDSKGITLQRGFGENDPRITLKWNKVEKRISELIRMDRYLNPKEVELYPAWLEQQEEHRQEQRERQAVREVLNTAPPEQEPEPDTASHYEYHLGDKVYLGADEYEILSLVGDMVLLHDTKFPLFNKEETRADFERKVQENPLNDHLKVRDTESVPVLSDLPKEEDSKPDDRFHVIELDRGYQTAYGIWDDVQDSQYVDEEGVSEEFLSEWQASAYVEKLNAEWKEQSEQERPPEPEMPVIPAWEQPKRTKVQTFDLHPDIPMAERLTFDLAAHEVEEVGKKERFRRNIMAIQLLKKCEDENRFATPEEQIILSKYVGWGGIPEAFDESNSSWETEYLELKTVLTPKDYASAKESTLTAFYTPPVVIQSIYKAMERMGFKEGNILEPSCGIGNFIGMLPQSMQEAKFYGVELDKISAAIAQQLHQRSSIAAQPFEEANIPDSFFDAVVGNVPFGDFSVADKKYDKVRFSVCC